MLTNICLSKSSPVILAGSEQDHWQTHLFSKDFGIASWVFHGNDTKPPMGKTVAIMTETAGV